MIVAICALPFVAALAYVGGMVAMRERLRAAEKPPLRLRIERWNGQEWRALYALEVETAHLMQAFTGKPLRLDALAIYLERHP